MRHFEETNLQKNIKEKNFSPKNYFKSCFWQEFNKKRDAFTSNMPTDIKFSKAQI